MPDSTPKPLDLDLIGRVDAALEAAYPSTPLMVLARTINRLAEVLPKGHECESIFAEFDAVGDYIQNALAEVERLRGENGLLERAASALASLVWNEYPKRYTLAEIADTWGDGITPEQVEALRVLWSTPSPPTNPTP